MRKLWQVNGVQYKNMDELIKTAWLKTWRGIEIVRVVKENDHWATISHNRKIVRFSKKTGKPHGEHPKESEFYDAVYIQNLDKYLNDEECVNQWHSLKYPGREKFEQIKKLLGDDFKKLLK